jgi:hypothetical protein
MNKIASALVGALAASLAAMNGALAQQVSGQVGSGPPEDIFLTITLGANGAGITLSETEFHLAWGGYYRFNLECPAAGVANEAGLSFSAPDLWTNSHIRLVSVSDPRSGFQEVPEINFHLQGLQLRMIDCEGMEAAARFSFFPMRKGTFEFVVLDDTVQPNVEVKGSFIVE